MKIRPDMFVMGPAVITPAPPHTNSVHLSPESKKQTNEANDIRQFSEPALEEAAFGAVLGELSGAAVCVPRLVGPPKPSQELGPGRMQVAEVVQTKSVDDAQGRLGPFGLGDGDGTIQLNDGRAGKAGQLAVQCGDLRPVARRLGVQGGDGGLQDVGPTTAKSERAIEFDAPSGDLRRVP